MKTLRRKTSLLLILFLGLSFSSFSQNITCDNPYPNCFGLNGIYFSDPSNGWAVGKLGLVARYNGTDWALDNQQDKTQQTLTKAFFLDANTGWIVGNNGTILKYKDGIYTLQTSGTTQTINDVYFVDENHGWAVTTYNIILKYTSGVWSVDKATDNATSFTLYGIHMVNTTRGWAVGAAGNMYYYNGTTWKKKTSPTTETLFEVTFADSTLGYAVGTGGMIIKYNMNDSWVKVPGQTGFVYDLYTVQILSANNVWSSGSYGTLIKYNGTSWSSGSANGVWYTGLSMVGPSDGWTFGTDGAIFKITGGVIQRFNTIFKKMDGTPDFSSVSDLSALSMKPDGNGWMVGYYGPLYEMRANVWKKQTTSLSSSNTYYDIAVVNDTLGFVVGTNGTIYKYNGTSWNLVTTSFQSSIASSSLYKIFILDPTHVYIVGTGGVFLRYGSGVWEKVAVTGQATTNFYDVQFLDVNTGWIVGATGTIVKYKNGTFTTQSYPNTSSIVKVFFFDETEGWTIAASNILQYKNNAWTTVSSSQVLVTDFAFTDKNNGLIIGPPYFDGGAGAVISKYTNGTCARIPNFNFTQNFSGISMFSPTQGVIAGRDGLILRIGIKPDVVTGIEENIFGRDIVNTTYSVVPNPASSHIQLYKSGSVIEDQRILITNLNGIIISDQFIKEGLIDISNLTKGMYFVRLTSSNNTLKFIKE